MFQANSRLTNQPRREHLRATARRQLRVENLEERRLLAVVAADGFESGNFGGGSEQWDSGSWVASGDASVRSDNSPASGSEHARLRRSTGDLQRTVDVTDLTDVRLQFSAKLISFEGSDRADVKVSGDGTNWTTLQSFFNGDDDGQYHTYDLAVPDVGNTLHIRFDAGMSGSGDYWYIDDVQVVGTPVPSGPPEVVISDATAIEGGSTLQNLGVFVTEGSGGSMRPRTNAFGPDRNGDSVDDLYFISADTDEILVYDGLNGSFIERFITGIPELDGSADMAFGDGYLFVNSLYDLGKVFRFDAHTGAYVDSIDVGTVGPLGITFVESGPYTGDLFVTDRLTNEVLRYDFDTDTVSPFVAAGSGGIIKPWKAIVGPDDNLYVTSNGTNQVLRYDGLTGDFLDVVATDVTATAVWLDFDSDGYLYLSGRTTAEAFDSTTFAQIDVNTGTVIQTYVLVDKGGHYFSLGPDNVIYISGGANGNHVLRAGPSSVASFEVTLSSASSLPVTVDFSTSGASATSGLDYNAVSGTLTFEPGVTTRTIIVPTIDDSETEPTESFFVNLSNASGAVIADGQGVGEIIDDEVPNVPPSVNAGADQTLNDDDASGSESVTLVGTAVDSDGTIDSVQWSEGATLLGDSNSLNITLSVGVHTLTFTATDDEGASSTDTVVIIVLPNQGPAANAGANVTVTDVDDNGSELVSLTGTGSDPDGTIVSYQWIEGGTVLGNTSSISPVLSVGTHVLTLTVTDNGGATASDSVIVTVEQPSDATALYVYDIRFESFWGGKYRRAIFEIRSDSNSDGQGSSADAVAAGVAITVQFDGRTYSGTTDSNGLFATSWRRKVSSGTHAEVIDLALTDFYWNPLALDLEDDSDGDGLPDATL